MKKIFIVKIAACLLVAAVIMGIGVFVYQGQKKPVDPEEEIVDEGTAEPEEKREWRERVDDPAEFEAEEIYWFAVFSYNEAGGTTDDISLWLYPGEERATINDVEFALNEETSNELRELIFQYSRTVKEQEDEYWPHTSEYPDMRTLFRFDMRSDEKQYKATGALCYPDGWEEFIKELKEIIL